jgi:hypothetical protein
MKISYSIRPNKKNMTYYESSGFCGVFSNLSLAYTFALRESKAREFEVSTIEVEELKDGLVLYKNVLEKKIVKRKEVEYLKNKF